MNRAQRLLERLGPGLITGAADDDPSGIATYSQAGAQFGLAMLWSVFLTTPLMVGIQVVSARIGRVTGHGIARNLRDHYPRPLMWFVVSLLLVANTINIAADIGAMGEALRARHRRPVAGVRACCSASLAVLMQLFIPYRYLAPILKWLTLSLFAYVAVLFSVDIPWTKLVVATLIPPLELTREYLMLLVGGARHDDQPVSVLLAGVAGSRGAARDRRRRAAARFVDKARASICGASRSTRGSA